MTRWEYQHAPSATSLAELNTLGGECWQVVGQTDVVEHLPGGGRTEERVWLLRRPVRDAAVVTGD
ncbi:MAG: hypothetical protein JWP61_1874 [Friedmanniella sp.]|jgi:hypothetical protein|nr:hypothetical protein [Friedmanniella sp.]